MHYLEIDVIELKQMLDDNAKFILLDEPYAGIDPIASLPIATFQLAVVLD